MANNANTCKDLLVHDFYKDTYAENEKPDPLQMMMDMQKKLQEDVYFPNVAEHVSYSKSKFSEFTLKELKDFLLTNEHALVDELHEMMDAVGGIKDGIGAGFWKHWKSSHKLTPEMTLKDLSPDDMKELVFEVIDAWHFFMNIFAALGLDSKTIFNFYFSKHAENINRQNNNY